MRPSLSSCFTCDVSRSQQSNSFYVRPPVSGAAVQCSILSLQLCDKPHDALFKLLLKHLVVRGLRRAAASGLCFRLQPSRAFGFQARLCPWIEGHWAGPLKVLVSACHHSVKCHCEG